MLRSGQRYRKPEMEQQTRQQQKQQNVMSVKFSGKSGTLDIQTFLRIFEFRCRNLNFEEKMDQLAATLEEPAIIFFSTEGLICESWEELKKIFIERYAIKKNTLKTLVSKTLKDYNDIHEYFDEKKEIATQLGLGEDSIIETLNNGLPENLRRIAIIKDFDTTTEWLRSMRKISEHMKDENDTCEIQRKESGPDTQQKNDRWPRQTNGYNYRGYQRNDGRWNRNSRMPVQPNQWRPQQSGIIPNSATPSRL